MPIDYSTGKIYRIYSPSHLEIGEYIGSTIESLAKRLGKHRRNYKSYKEGKYHYVSSFPLLDFEDVRIELIENHPCASKEELNSKEGEHIRGSGNCVNKQIAGRTAKEYREEHREEIKKYREDHREEISERKKKYYEEHREEISERKKKYREEHREELNARRREERRKKKEEELRNSVGSMTLM